MKVDYRSNPAYVLAHFAMQMGAKPEEIATRTAELAAYCDELVTADVMDAWIPSAPPSCPAFIGIDFCREYAEDLHQVERDLARWADDGGRNVEA